MTLHDLEKTTREFNTIKNDTLFLKLTANVLDVDSFFIILYSNGSHTVTAAPPFDR